MLLTFRIRNAEVVIGVAATKVGSRGQAASAFQLGHAGRGGAQRRRARPDHKGESIGRRPQPANGYVPFHDPQGQIVYHHGYFRPDITYVQPAD